MKPRSIIRGLLLIIMVITIKVSKAQQFTPSIKTSYGLVFLPSGEPNYKSTYFKTSNTKSIDLEYTYYKDSKVYYNSSFYGFTTGLKYNTSKIKLHDDKEKEYTEIIESISLPLLFSLKENEWNDVLRFGFIGTYDYKKKTDDNYKWNTKDYHLDIYLSFGFDNQILRYRTDGWVYTIEVYSQYELTNYIYKTSKDNKNIRLLRIGGRIGIAYIFDYYHYRRWYNNN